jgi:hypothetical protein
MIVLYSNHDSDNYSPSKLQKRARMKKVQMAVNGHRFFSSFFITTNDILHIDYGCDGHHHPGHTTPAPASATQAAAGSAGYVSFLVSFLFSFCFTNGFVQLDYLYKNYDDDERPPLPPTLNQHQNEQGSRRDASLSRALVNVFFCLR